jgi:uncharacterized protein (TIGR03000 family)
MKQVVFATLAAGLSLFMAVGLAQAQSKEHGGSPGPRTGTGTSSQSQFSDHWNRPGGYSYQGFPGWYGGYGWYGGSYNRPYSYGWYPNYYYGDNGMESGMPFGFGGPTAEPKARLLVVVPPDARVYVDDQATRQTGIERIYESPPLEQGTYTYNIRAKWTENGKEVSHEKKVKVEPGRMSVANFMQQGEEKRAGQPRTREYGSDEAVPRTPGRTDMRQQERGLPDEQQGLRDNQFHDGARNAQQFSGTIVDVNEQQIVLALDKTGDQRTFRLAERARVSKDGQMTDLKSLKPGSHISIMTKPDDPGIVTRLEVTKAPSTDR